MKNKLVLLGLGSAGLSTILAIVGTNILNERNFEHSTHLISAAVLLGLFSIMSFFGSKLWKE